MLSIRVADVLVIFVGYVIIGNNELAVSMSKEFAYAAFSASFNMFMLKSPDNNTILFLIMLCCITLYISSFKFVSEPNNSRGGGGGGGGSVNIAHNDVYKKLGEF